MIMNRRAIVAALSGIAMALGAMIYGGRLDTPAGAYRTVPSGAVPMADCSATEGVGPCVTFERGQLYIVPLGCWYDATQPDRYSPTGASDLAPCQRNHHDAVLG
jgi:hypothetical protein